jgi:hypothetical protein
MKFASLDCNHQRHKKGCKGSRKETREMKRIASEGVAQPAKIVASILADECAGYSILS